MTNGEQCVMMAGAVLMLLLSASSWVMQLLEVSTIIVQFVSKQQICCFFSGLQVEFHIATLSLVLVLDPSTWMMLLVLQVIVSYWSALAGQSWYIIVLTLPMLVSGVKVIFF